MSNNPALSTVLANWNLDPVIVVGCAVLTLVYINGLWTLVQRGKFQRLVGIGPVCAFSLGVLSLVAALLSPLASYDDQLFIAHMTQHIMLLMVAPPLLLLGKPIPVLLLGLPQGLVRWVARAHHRTLWFRRVTAGATSVAGSFVLFVGATLFWHLPPFFQATLTNQGIHIFEHLSFFLTGLLSWWVIIDPLPGPARRDPGIRLLYCLAVGMPMTILGAVMLLATNLWYPFYAAVPRLWGISALDDQRIGALLMATPAGLIYVAAMSVLFMKLMTEEDTERPIIGIDEPGALPVSSVRS